MNTSDIDIWKAFKRGDEDAFLLIYNTYFIRLCAYGYKFSLDTHLVEDCVQDVFIEIIKRRKKLSDTDNIQFYLMRSVRSAICTSDEPVSVSCILNLFINLDLSVAVKTTFISSF